MPQMRWCALIRFLWPTSWQFGLGLLALALEAISAVALLASSAYLISRASEQPPILHLMMAVVGVRAFALGRATFRYLHRIGLHDSVFEQMANLRPLLFRHLSYDAVGNRSSTRDLDRLTTDMERLQDWVLRIIGPIVQVIVATATAVVIIWIWFPLAGLMVLVLAGSLVGVTFAITLISSTGAQRKRVVLSAELRFHLTEYIENRDLLSSFGLLEKRKQKVQEIGRELGKIDSRLGMSVGLAAALLSFSAVLTSGTTGLLASLSQGLTPGHLLALAVLTPLAIFDIANQIQGSATALSSVRLSWARVKEILDISVDLDEGKKLQAVQGIEFSNASIYRDGSQLLKAVSFSMVAGQILTLTGKSGLGKSTLALMVSGLTPPTEGFFINGLPASQFASSQVRARIRLIEQEPHLFAGTIRENLAIAGVRSDAQMQQVLEATKLWGEIEHRGGLDLEAEEFGRNLSGGQLQRLGIARGLLSEADFLVLDEPTSGLDWENAVNLSAIIFSVRSKDRGVLVITHDRAFAELLGESVNLDAFGQHS